jgi:hypothetical protein
MTKKTIEKKIYKKRGRKPKGGKIVENIEKIKVENNVQNIILHIKCSLKDLDNYNEDNIEHYKFDNKNELRNYKVLNNKNEKIEEILEEKIEENLGRENNIDIKLKELSINLHNNIVNNKSNCFWCTYNFDNESIYIPKYIRNDVYYSYGCFCSPECATSYLFNENIDTSKKFERYKLLNNIYCKIYDYDINIKPAPDPHYTLQKFCGNLTIQEYRKLLKNERVLLTLEKPISTLLPELYEDYSLQSINKFKVRQKTTKKSKKHIMETKFNI